MSDHRARGPVDRIDYAARVSLFRALGFTTLGIGTMMLGLSWDPPLALLTGAALTAIVAAVLWYKARAAASRDYRTTEVWVLLDKKHGISDERAQQVFGQVLGGLYRQYAEYAMIIAAGQWLLNIAARLA